MFIFSQTGGNPLQIDFTYKTIRSLTALGNIGKFMIRNLHSGGKNSHQNGLFEIYIHLHRNILILSGIWKRKMNERSMVWETSFRIEMSINKVSDKIINHLINVLFSLLIFAKHLHYMRLGLESVTLFYYLQYRIIYR